VPSEGSSIEHGILVAQWKWPLRVAFWVSMISVSVLLYSMGAQWLWSTKRSPEDKLAYTEAIVAYDGQVLQSIGSGAVVDAPGLANWIVETLEEDVVKVVIGTTRALLGWPAEYKARREGTFKPDPDKQRAADNANEYVRSVRLYLQGFAVRTAIYASMAPLLALLMVLASVDGFAARAIRRATAGRESASLYHRAKLGQPFVAIMGYIAVLGLPEMSDPHCTLVPLAMLIALLLRTQTAYYKKYL
jgi:integrating conjugative element membrane protein (TIGR03747 family)